MLYCHRVLPTPIPQSDAAPVTGSGDDALVHGLCDRRDAEWHVGQHHVVGVGSAFVHQQDDAAIL